MKPLGSEPYVAPGLAVMLREAARCPRSGRKIKIVDADGNIVREEEIEDVRDKILKREEIELSVFDAVCAGYVGHRCRKLAPKSAFAPSIVAKRNGRPWRCASCAGIVRPKKVLSHEEKTERNRKIREGIVAYRESLSEQEKAKKIDTAIKNLSNVDPRKVSGSAKTMTTEVRRENLRKARKFLSKEQMRENMRKAREARMRKLSEKKQQR